MRLRMSALAAVVLLAGCTALPGATGDTGDGVQATAGLDLSFQQLGSFALETEDAQLQLTVENVGQSEAESVSAQIFGASWISGSHSFGSLQGIDRAAGQPGDTGITQWELEPPNVDVGTTETFDATAQVSYVYTTVAIIPVALSPEGFAESQSTVTTSNTAGPVQLSTELETPIPTRGTDTHSIPITVSNAGDGTLSSQVDISGDLIDAGGEVSLSDCDKGVSVDQESSVTCTLETPQDGVSFDTEAQVRITARYEYVEEASTTVRVRGVQGAG